MTDALSDDDQQARLKSVVEMMPSTPFIGWLGLVFEEMSPDRAVIRLPFRHELTNDGTFYHGGVVASVIDTCGAMAAWSGHDFNKGMRASTITMSVQYVGACKQSDLICRAQAVKRGKELIFTEITATDSDDVIVAHAVQTYRIV